MKKSTRAFLLSGILFFLFLLLTLGLLLTKGDSSVGFYALNRSFFEFVGITPIWYTITEYLGMIPIFVGAVFAGLGLGQLCKRHSLKKVDADLYCLGALYAVMAGAYLFFELFPVNMRPTIVNGELGSSFPSSHTVLVCVVMLSCALQLQKRVSSKRLRITGQALCLLFFVLMPIGRLLAGVHWLTDILGGVLLSLALTALYHAATLCISERTKTD